LTAFSSGALLEVMNKRKVFLITATFPLLIVISAYLLDEKKVEFHQKQEEEPVKNQSSYSSIEEEHIKDKPMDEYRNSKFNELKKQVSLFYTFLKMDAIYKPVIFIFCYMLTPSYGDPLFYFYTNVLNFAPMTLGRLRLIYGIASVIGIWFYNKYLRNVGFKKIMWWTTMLSMFFNMLSIVVVSRINLKIGIPDFWFCLTADALTTALAEINTMPLLVLACNICPKNIEGTLYAFLMSVINLGSLFSNQFGSILTSKLGITSTNFANLSLLIFIANIVLIVPMPALYLVNESAYVNLKDEPKETDEKETDKLFAKKDDRLASLSTNIHTLEEVKTETVSLDNSFNNNSFTKL
jgi:folate/biopterin transporter